MRIYILIFCTLFLTEWAMTQQTSRPSRPSHFETKKLSLTCIDSAPYIKYIRNTSACERLDHPTYKHITISESSEGVGNIDFEFNFSFPSRVENCSNPRGWPVTQHVALPILDGTWKVQYKDQELGYLNLSDGLCEVSANELDSLL